MFYLSLLFTTIVWGLNVIIDKKALKTGHPIEINFITTIVMAMVVTIYFLISKRIGIVFAFSPQTVFLSVVNGILIPTSLIAYLFALSKGDTKTVVLVTASYPIIAIMIAMFAFNEVVSFHQWFGMMLAIFGIFLVIK
jgi:uncharacterized membrane protein